jgi:hypothetical protein
MFGWHGPCFGWHGPCPHCTDLFFVFPNGDLRRPQGPLQEPGHWFSPKRVWKTVSQAPAGTEHSCASRNGRRARGNKPRASARAIAKDFPEHVTIQTYPVFAATRSVAAAQGPWQPSQGPWQPSQGPWQPSQGPWHPSQGPWHPSQGPWQSPPAAHSQPLLVVLARGCPRPDSRRRPQANQPCSPSTPLAERLR